MRLGKVIVFWSLLVLAVTKLFFIDIGKIDGISMEPTLKNGQIFLYNRVYFGILVPFTNQFILRWNKPQKGDIIVFYHTNSERLLIKRCAAVAGDSIGIQEGYLSVNGGQNRVYVGAAFQLKGYYTVPGGKVLVLGDNSADSIDSRYFGFVQEDTIIGKIIRF